MPIFLLVSAVGIGILTLLYFRTLRPVGNDLIRNGSFEEGPFSGGGSAAMDLFNGSTTITDWQVVGGIKWSREQGSGIGPADGDFFVDLLGRSPTGVGGGVAQGVGIPGDGDYELKLFVGTPPTLPAPLTTGPATIRVTIEDSLANLRRSWDRTSPLGNGMKWEPFSFKFNTDGFVLIGAGTPPAVRITILAPRDRNQSTSFVGLDKVSLFRLRSLLER